MFIYRIRVIFHRAADPLWCHRRQTEPTIIISFNVYWNENGPLNKLNNPHSHDFNNFQSMSLKPINCTSYIINDCILCLATHKTSRTEQARAQPPLPSFASHIDLSETKLISLLLSFLVAPPKIPILNNIQTWDNNLFLIIFLKRFDVGFGSFRGFVRAASTHWRTCIFVCCGVKWLDCIWIFSPYVPTK